MASDKGYPYQKPTSHKASIFKYGHSLEGRKYKDYLADDLIQGGP